MRLFLFRLSLKPYRQAGIFQRRQADGADHTRETWLRERLSQPLQFIHRQNDFYFVPEKSETKIPNEIIVGWVARPRAVNERTPPWDGLSLTEHESWQAALVMIDPRHHEDGQKVAMEARPDVGTPESILLSLARALSPNEQEPFSVTVFPIIEERSFASFAAAHPNSIKSITYEASVPNMFGGADDFSSEMRSLRDEANVSKVKTRLESDGTIDIERSKLSDIASHVERGGGKIKAITNDGASYNSDEHAAFADVDTAGTDPKEKSFWEKICDALDRIF